MIEFIIVSAKGERFTVDEEIFETVRHTRGWGFVYETKNERVLMRRSYARSKGLLKGMPND